MTKEQLVSDHRPSILRLMVARLFLFLARRALGEKLAAAAEAERKSLWRHRER